jgi:hypothetical protein
MYSCDLKRIQETFTDGMSEYQLNKRFVNRSLAGLNIAFIVGSLGISGGTNIILNHISFLRNNGAKVVIFAIFADEDVPRWHEVLEKIDIYPISAAQQFGKFDVAVFTWWRTIEYLLEIPFKHGVYFVQSIESRFYLRSNQRYVSVVDLTYQLGLSIITVSPWIAFYLYSEYSVPAVVVPNGIDKAIFNCHGMVEQPKKVSERRVLIEGPLGVEFKQTEYAIDVCKEALPDWDVWLATGSEYK